MKTVYYFLALLILTICACEEKKLEPISKSLGKPGTVEILKQEEIPGGVILTYRIPDTEDILSVKAEYTLSDGRRSESTASFYENNLTIAGYSDMQEYEAKIYVINRAQERSDPVTIHFTPLEASFRKAAKTMEIVSDFGGARFIWKNPDKALLTFEFFAQDSLGSLQAMRIFTSSAEEMKFSLRGYKPEARWFAAIIRDYWDNVTDTIYPPEIIVPFFEEKIDKTGMRVLRLNNEPGTGWQNWEGRDEYLIDDVYFENCGISPTGSANVNAFATIDLGAMVKLSRVVVFHRYMISVGEAHLWTVGNWRTFNIYVCYGTPSQSGDLNEWTLVKECETFKPSGLPIGTNTDEDIQAVLNGFEFELDLEMPPVRYLRFFAMTTWGGATYTHASELDFFGFVVED